LITRQSEIVYVLSSFATPPRSEAHFVTWFQDLGHALARRTAV